MPKLKVVELFAGVGGFRIGLKNLVIKQSGQINGSLKPEFNMLLIAIQLDLMMVLRI